MQHIVSFSGGKDSTAMLLMMIERKMQIDRIIYVDTTKEFPGMYDHIQRVQDYISPLKIEIIKIAFDYWFCEHVKTKGKNKGSKGYGWPDFRNRWCTALKRGAFNKAVHSKSAIQYHGIAYDEAHRAKNNADGRVIRYPLIDWCITEADALTYCYRKGFDWCGLYDDFVRVSCWCCPLSRMGELHVLHDKYPELWTKLVQMDKMSYRKFKPNYSVNALEMKFTGGK